MAAPKKRKLKPVKKQKAKRAAPKKVAPKKRTVTKAHPVLKKKAARKAQKKNRPLPKQARQKIHHAGKTSRLELERFFGNPIIEPEGDLYWESKATFNPTAIIRDGIVHLLYRAIGETDTSVLGYAASDDGLHFKKQSSRAVYAHHQSAPLDKTADPVAYGSGGGWSGGCEDPRLVIIGDTVYMTYTAFDGWGSVRIALTSIRLDDFLNKRWHWKEPVLISAPGELNKNWVLFPEKINGKFAILHSISPAILVEYVSDLRIFDGKTFIHSIHRDSPSWSLRDRSMRGVGPAPIKTKHGWLVFYHGTEDKDPDQYKVWAMILDEADPTKVVYRSRKPVLEPQAYYENTGLKSGIVYSCGAVVKNGKLFVYYGGADKVACVATADLDAFLKELIASGTPRLTPEKKK